MASSSRKPYPKAPETYTFTDYLTETPDTSTLYKVLVDSDEGRTFASLTNDADRVRYMRQHAHQKQENVQAQWAFYEDTEAGKRYLIRNRSPEGEEVSRMMNLDEEKGKLGQGAVLRYYREHAHVVEDI